MNTQFATAATVTPNPHRILVVDDDPLMRIAARAALEKAGHEVIEADSGETALEAIEGEAPDGVLLDLTMPGLDGYATCSSLRERLDEDPIPIVIVTASDDLDAIERSFSVGATDFVTKPINWPVLKQRLNYLVRNRYVALDLQDSELGRRALLETVPDTIARVDRQGRLCEFKMSREGTAFDARLMVAQSLFEALPEASVAEARRALQATLAGAGSSSFEFALEDDGHVGHYEVRMVVCGEDHATLMVRDFTQKKLAMERIRQLAYTDPLTGLPNTAAFHEALDARRSEQRQAPQVDAVLRISLDNLGYVESVYGHRVKDEVVRRAGRRLRLAFVDATRRGGLVARIRDHEFAVLAPMLKRDSGIDALMDGAEHSLAQVFEVEGRELRMITSIGTAQSPVDGSGMQLFDRAASALDEARRDAVTRRRSYSKDIHRQARDEADMEARLRRAIHGDGIHLVYQPKFAAQDGRIVGVEALVRWEEPQLGPVSPGVFIPLAERCGLILPLGEKIMEMACLQALAWRDGAVGEMPIAVNFSGQEFSRADLPATFAETLARHGLDSRAVEIEITETAAVADTEMVRVLLGELNTMGVRVAIDDFGTGFSSLGLLRDLPFDILKIDRSFVDGLGTDPTSEAITRAIIDMGRALGMQIVAEGVENDTQKRFLVAHGCDILQGFLLGRPMTADRLFAEEHVA